MQHPVQGRQVGGHPRRLGPQQLGGVRIFLLGHDRRPRREGVGDLAEPELLAGPEHHLRAQPGEMGAAGGGGRQEVQDEVAVGDRVDRVLRHRREPELARERPAIGGEVDAGQRAGAQREAIRTGQHAREALVVAAEHPEVGQQVVREIDRLGALKVGVAGHRPVQVVLGHLQERGLQRAQRLPCGQRVGAHEHRHVRRHLVVARARRVQPAAHRAGELGDPALDRHVDVLVGLAERERAVVELPLHRLQGLEQGVAVVGLEDPALGQHAHVRARLGHVVGTQPPVE